MATQLFFVSRAVSRDARAFYYSVNEFRIDNLGGTAISRFKALTPLALSSLRRIRVHISISHGHLSGDPGDHIRLLGYILHEDTFLDKHPQLLARWRKFCRHLAAHIEPDRLDLEVETWAERRRTAEAILSPLLQLPRLRKCSIWIETFRDPSVRPFVEALVQKLTAPSNAAFVRTPSRTFYLPAEIQISILEQAGVINPEHRLEWCAKQKVFCDTFCLNGVCQNTKEIECGLRYVCCSSSRRCWTFPTGLFQAFRSLRHQAQYLFYSRHSFRVNIRWPYPPRQFEWPFKDRIFLVPILREGLHYLRHFRWTFPTCLDDTAFLPGQRETNDLIKAVGYLAENAVLSKLTLILDFENHIIRESFDMVIEPGPKAMWILYQRIARRLCPLRGLKDVFVYLPREEERYWVDQDEERGVRLEHERLLEILIKGDSNYDSSSRGKYLVQNSDISPSR